MKRIRFSLAVVIVLLCLAAVSCTRSASKSALIAPTLSGEVPFPVASQPPLMIDILAVTQTAIAGGMDDNVDSSGEETAAETVDETSPEPSEPPLSEEPTEAEEPAATEEPLVFPTSTPGKPETYTLQVDEHPYCLARRFNVNPDDLLSLNKITENTVLFPGMELKIPTTGSWETGPRSLKEHPTRYTVLAGDTLYKIACGFGDVSPNEILDANQLESADDLTIGQVLLIP